MESETKSLYRPRLFQHATNTTPRLLRVDKNLYNENEIDSDIIENRKVR